MSDLTKLRHIIVQLRSADNAQKLEGILAAHAHMAWRHTEETKAQFASQSREERLCMARLPRDLFGCMYSNTPEIAREAAFVLVANSKSFHSHYLQYRQFADLGGDLHEAFVEHLEALLRTMKVDVMIESDLVYSREDEKYYYVSAVCKVYNCTQFTVGGKKVRLRGLSKVDEDFFSVLAQYPHAEKIGDFAVEPSAAEKESGVTHKGVANLRVVKELYDSLKDGIRVHMFLNSVRTGKYMKIAGMPEKASA